ncbi:SGNH/GDSL hydrolase family protein [Virgibacillus kimchii]
MLKKKLYLIAVIVFVLAAAALLYYISQPSVDFENVSLEVEEEDSVPEDEENHQMETLEDEQEEEEEQEEDIQSQLPRPLSEAVHAAVDFFSGRTLHILALGDSLTQGVGDSRGQGGYVGLLERSINAEEELAYFENLGRRGTRSDQLLQRLEEPETEEAITDADIILVTIGANDVMRVLRENITDLDIQDFLHENGLYEDRLYNIFSQIEDINSRAEIYLIGIFNPFDRYFQEIPELNKIVDEWNKSGETVAEDFDAITFIPIEDLFDDHDDDLFAEDNFHPNDEGYRRIAQRVLDYLTDEEG